MNDHLTKIPGVPDATNAVPGMAHFAGTGPPGKLCENCAFWRYYRKTAEKWNPQQEAFTYRSRRHGGCEKYWKLAGRHGPAISGKNRCCKYFEPGPEKQK
jgi:hypothetical protein